MLRKAGVPAARVFESRKQAVAYFTGSELLHRPRGAGRRRRAGRVGRGDLRTQPRPDDLIELPASAGLPEVGAIDLVLLTNPRSATQPAEALTAAILASGHPVKSRQD